MAGDIEAFLKMAAERRRKAMEAQNGGAQAPQQQPTPARQPQQEPRSNQPMVNRTQSARPAPPPPRPAANVPYSQPRKPTSKPLRGRSSFAEVEMVEAEPIDNYYDSESKSPLAHNLVSDQVSSIDISSHAENLDDHWETSLTDDEAAKKRNNLAKELVAMLSNPNSITKSIVINEILRRPDFD